MFEVTVILTSPEIVFIRITFNRITFKKGKI